MLTSILNLAYLFISKLGVAKSGFGSLATHDYAARFTTRVYFYNETVMLISYYSLQIITGSTILGQLRNIANCSDKTLRSFERGVFLNLVQ